MLYSSRAVGAAERQTVSRMRIVALLAVLFIAQDLAACSCAIFPPKDEFKRMSAVFRGEVVAVDANNEITFSVRESFKGADQKLATVRGQRISDCGVEVAVGQEFLVWAYHDSDGRLTTNICTRTRPALNMPGDLLLLRKRSTWWRNPLSSVRVVRWWQRVCLPR